MVSTWDTSIRNCSYIALPISAIAPSGVAVDWRDWSSKQHFDEGYTLVDATAVIHTYTAPHGLVTTTLEGSFGGWDSENSNSWRSSNCLI